MGSGHDDAWWEGIDDSKRGPFRRSVSAHGDVQRVSSGRWRVSNGKPFDVPVWVGSPARIAIFDSEAEAREFIAAGFPGGFLNE